MRAQGEGRPRAAHRMLQLARERGAIALPPQVDDFSPAFADLMRGMLDRDPANRMTAKDCMAHPFFGAAPPMALS